MEPPGDPKGSPGGFSVSKNFDTLLKNAGIFSRGCRPLRALAFARTLAAWGVCFPTYTPPENTI